MPEFLDFDQNTPEWHEARRGVVTASRFKDVMAKGQGKTRQKYLFELAGEIITGEPMEGFTNAHMERGHKMEPDARDMYAFVKGVDPARIGFVKDGRVGCSPDSLIGDDGLLEIKTKLPHLMVECIMRDKFPPEHVAQCQGALWVTGRQWIDIAVYWPGFPLFIKRAERDEAMISTIRDEVSRFIVDLDQTVSEVRAYGGGA